MILKNEFNLLYFNAIELEKALIQGSLRLDIIWLIHFKGFLSLILKTSLTYFMSVKQIPKSNFLQNWYGLFRKRKIHVLRFLQWILEILEKVSNLQNLHSQLHFLNFYTTQLVLNDLEVFPFYTVSHLIKGKLLYYITSHLIIYKD